MSAENEQNQPAEDQDHQHPARLSSLDNDSTATSSEIDKALGTTHFDHKVQLVERQRLQISEYRSRNDELRKQIQQVLDKRKMISQSYRRREYHQFYNEALHQYNDNVYLQQQCRLYPYEALLRQHQKLHGYLEVSTAWNVLNDSFFISHAGPFATINGLRVGHEASSLTHLGEADDSSGRRRNTQSTTETEKVPWSEINAALGQVALLLSILSERQLANIRYRHTIHPLGSTSRIAKGGAANNTYALYSDDSFQLFMGKRNFNIAMQCLMECILDAYECIHRLDPTIVLPYPIVFKNVNGGETLLTVGGLPVIYSQTTEWTRACKYWMTNLKHLLRFRALYAG